MRLRVYRSLLGSSSSVATTTTAGGGCCASALASFVSNNNDGNVDADAEARLRDANPPLVGHGHCRRRFAFDGALLRMDQLFDTATTLELSSLSSSLSPFVRGGPLYGMRLICQLEPQCEDDASDQLRRLAEFLDSVTNCTRGDPSGGGIFRPTLDMVVIRAPPSSLSFPNGRSTDNNNDDNDLEDEDGMEKTLEYLSSTLSAASMFLESIPPGSVGTSGEGGSGSGLDRCNVHGRPLGRHILGVSHHLPGVDLERLSELADVFPPTRFALDPANLCSSRITQDAPTDTTTTTTTHDQDTSSDTTTGGGGAPSTSDVYGLSRELEAVVQGTDILRVSPSTFQPLSTTSHVKEEGNGLFGAGTLFGEVWCAQELDGALETYVICDDDDDDVEGRNQEDSTAQEREVQKGTGIGDNASSSLPPLAVRIRTAFDESAVWRSGAETRREEEIKEATLAAHRTMDRSSWMIGRYSPEVMESARVLGLTDSEAPLDNSKEGRRLTSSMIKKRWRALAFQSHPDTANVGDIHEIYTEDEPTFVVLRQHFLTLMEAVRQDERGTDDGVPKM